MRLLNQLLYQSTDAIEAFLSPAADAITAKVAPVQAVAAALIAGHRLEQRHKYGSKKKGGVGDAASADDEDQEELMNLSELALRCFAGSFARHEPAAQMMLDHALGVSFLHPDTHFSHMSHPILPIFQNLIRFLGQRCTHPSCNYLHQPHTHPATTSTTLTPNPNKPILALPDTFAHNPHPAPTPLSLPLLPSRDRITGSARRPVAIVCSFH